MKSEIITMFISLKQGLKIVKFLCPGLVSSYFKSERYRKVHLQLYRSTELQLCRSI